MKFRNKILLAISSVVLVLLLITSVIIKYWMGVQVESRFTEDLRSNYTTLHELNTLRSEEIMKSSEIIAETPRLKAVVELGDRNTVLQLARELNANIISDYFLVMTSHRQALVELIDGVPTTMLSRDTSTLSAIRPDTSSINVYKINHTVYRCATVPIIIGSDVIGTLSLGFRIERDDLNAIKAMTNSDVALTLGDTLIASTLSSDSHNALAVWLKEVSKAIGDRFDRATGSEKEALISTIQTTSDKYLVTAVSLNGRNNISKKAIAFILLKPVEKEIEAALRPVFNTFIILSLIVLIVTVAIGYLISQGITRPIAALVRGTNEISRGNYDYAIAVGSDAELRYLAEKFQEMSHSLKEKMFQLAERNEKLEEALQQLKETQAELVRSERLAATGKLTAQISHEINNPVHNIQSCLQTLMKRLNASSTNKPEMELLEVALDEVTRLATLTRQMLDVYRTSMVPIERVQLCLNDVITDVLATAEESFKMQHIAIKRLLSTSLPTIEGSKDKLKQVFLNLFINAKDAMPNGGTLSVETTKENGNVIVNIADTGIGIPPENINRIFDAFFTTKSTVSGVGLGLSVTYGIVRQHDGTITVKSKVGEGSTFSLLFPIKQS
jgi:signal transduction histidine kinase